MQDKPAKADIALGCGLPLHHSAFLLEELAAENRSNLLTVRSITDVNAESIELKSMM